MKQNQWGYPFIFVMNDYTDHDDQLLYTLQYRFKSAKSHHTYIVRAEKYVKHLYCVKFFDKANMDSPNKFSLRTNTYEPRTILLTIYSIMQDIKEKDPKASFFFIGAEDERDESAPSTRRFRFYKRFVSSVVGNSVYEHYYSSVLSLYILIDKNSTEDTDSLAQHVVAEVRKAFHIE